MDHHVIVIDGLNFMHKAASFAMRQPGPIIVRGLLTALRSLVERLGPSRIIIVLEGKPRDRLASFPAYKANRIIDAGTPEHDARSSFLRWCDAAMGIAARHLPVTIVRHPHFEADDVVHTIISRSSRAVPFTIVSSDTDFIQELEVPNVRLWDPVRDRFVEHPGYHYVTWKSLRGDPGDGIPGIPGIGNIRAARLMEDPDGLAELLGQPQAAERFVENMQLIQLAAVPENELDQLQSSVPIRDWAGLRAELLSLGVRQVTLDPYWSEKFVPTFECLWTAPSTETCQDGGTGCRV
jgi:5'-3' exonuclease